MRKPVDVIRLPSGTRVNVIPPLSKMNLKLINSYRTMLPESTINTIYAKPSHEKIAAYEEILREAYTNNGYGLRVGHSNSFSFSMGYLIDIGHFTYLVYHTKEHRKITVYRVKDI